MTKGKNIKKMAAVAIVFGMLFCPARSSAMVAAPAGNSGAAYVKEIRGITLVLDDGRNYDLAGIEIVNSHPGVSAKGKNVEMLFIEDKLKKVIIH